MLLNRFSNWRLDKLLLFHNRKKTLKLIKYLIFLMCQLGNIKYSQARIALAGGARARSALPSQSASPPQQRFKPHRPSSQKIKARKSVSWLSTRPVPVLSAAPAAPAAPRQPSPAPAPPQTVTPPTTSPVAPMPSPAEQARLERERQRKREQERRRREAQVVYTGFNQLIYNTFFLQQNQIDMNRQSDMMAAFEENII